MNTRAILFILGLAVGAIAVFLWKRSQPEDQSKKPDVTELQNCEEQLRQARAKLALSSASAVYIGPSAGTLSDEQLAIHVDKQPVVYWKPWLPGQGHTVGITFDVKDYPTPAYGEPPFVGGKKNASQIIPCAGETCFSYDLNSNVVAVFATPGPLPCPTPMPNHPPFDKNDRCLDYKYSQTLDKETKDGHIIIVKP